MSRRWEEKRKKYRDIWYQDSRGGRYCEIPYRLERGMKHYFLYRCENLSRVDAF